MSLPDGQFEYISPAATEIFGYPPHDFYQNPLLIKQIMHPDWQDYLEEKWAETLSGKVSTVYEYQIICKTGEVRWIYQKNTLIRDMRGNLMAVEGIATDITDRKKAEDELKRSHERLRNLSAYLQTTIENERKNIAREVHDDLGQTLTAIKMDTVWLHKRFFMVIHYHCRKK